MSFGWIKMLRQANHPSIDQTQNGNQRNKNGRILKSAHFCRDVGVRDAAM